MTDKIDYQDAPDKKELKETSKDSSSDSSLSGIVSDIGEGICDILSSILD